jgi:hypothetical protein
MRPQYVNLWRQSGGWQSRLCKARGAAMALLLLAGGLVVLTTIASVGMQLGQDEVDRVTAASGERRAALQAASEHYQLDGNYRNLQQRVQQLQRIIARQDVILSSLRDTDLNSAATFSARLAAIARVRVDGVWLTQMNFAATPASLKLSGVAMDADLLPRYLAQLGGTAQLGVRQLDTLTLDRSVTDARAAAAGAVGFILVLQNEAGRGPS